MRLARCIGKLLAVLVCAAPLAAQARPPRVAVVLDRQSVRFQPLVQAFQREVQGFFRAGDVELLPPIAGDGTAAGVGRVLDRVMRDSSIAAVVTLGSVGSHLMARAGVPAKPVIAGIIVDATWQGIPQRDGTSGVRRLAYVDESYPIGRSLADFHQLIPFRRIAVLLDRPLLDAIPQLDSAAKSIVRQVGAEAVIVPADGDPERILSALDPEVDAVYLTPLPQFNDQELGRLLAGINARKLATLSYLAEPDLHAGALASYEPPENWQRRARRIAVDLQRILSGEDAGTLPVRLVSAPRLTLNLRTARAIGFTPSRSLLTDAELVGVDSAGPADTLSLGDAMRAAASRSLDLEMAALTVASGAEAVRKSRANLLPRIESSLSETVTREATAAASLGRQPERQLEGGVSLSLPLYSEKAWAGYGSERQIQAARRAQQDQVRLDVVMDAASAYLDVLRAGTLREVRRSNLYRTRSNLEVARLREGVGSASRADIYRWEGEVANARRDLLAAESQARVAALALNKSLNRPLDRPLAQPPVSLADPALLMRDSTVLAWLDQPERLASLTGFLTSEAAKRSPELAQADASVAAQRRQYTAAGRAFWIPTVGLSGGFSNEFSRGGAGTEAGPIPLGPEATWQFKLQVSTPLFTGFERRADRAKTRLDLSRLQVERESVRQSIDQRVRASLETATSSYAAIALSRDASVAATRNYDLVSDAYGRGTASITTLIDAQSAALNAQESAANAIHDFLLDLLRVERAMGAFGALQTPEQRAAFLQRLISLRTQP